MEQLIIRLGSYNTSRISWLVWSSAESEIIASGELPDAAELHTLTERAGQRPVIALCPASDVLLKWVTLPPRSSRKVLAAVPFMLEDELSEDISELFFAMGPKQGDEQAVAIVRHTQMQVWQAQLAEAGLSCHTLIPDVLAVPVNEEGMSVLTLGESILIRQDEWKGFQAEESWIVPVLSQLTKAAPQAIKVRNYGNTDLGLVPNCHVEIQNSDMPLAVLAKSVLLEKFNLLQGEYRIRKQSHSAWKQWRVAAILAGVVFSFTLVDKAVTLQSLKSQNSELKAQIQELVIAGFPQARGARDIRRRIIQELAKLENGSGSASMLNMLSQLESAFASSEVKPQSIRFDSTRNEIRLQALASNFESLEQFRRRAEAAGFAVDQGAINNRDEGVVGSLAIRSGV